MLSNNMSCVCVCVCVCSPILCRWKLATMPHMFSNEAFCLCVLTNAVPLGSTRLHMLFNKMCCVCVLTNPVLVGSARLHGIPCIFICLLNCARVHAESRAWRHPIAYLLGSNNSRLFEGACKLGVFRQALRY